MPTKQGVGHSFMVSTFMGVSFSLRMDALDITCHTSSAQVFTLQLLTSAFAGVYICDSVHTH